MMTLDELFALKQRQSTDLSEHMITLTRYARMCRSITEFGVRGGCSTAALLAGHPESLVSFDIAPFEEQNLFRRIAEANGIRFQFIQRASEAGPIEPTELLFIDTLHTYDQLDEELSLHAASVSKYIIVHDTYSQPSAASPENSGKEMWIAICKLLGNDGWWIVEDFKNQHGLTVLGRR